MFGKGVASRHSPHGIHHSRVLQPRKQLHQELGRDLLRSRDQFQRDRLAVFAAQRQLQHRLHRVFNFCR